MRSKKGSDPHGLYRRWCENPTDETLARVYADALMERGDSLGEVLALALEESPASSSSDFFSTLSLDRWLLMAKETARAVDPAISHVGRGPNATVTLMLTAEAWLKHRKRLREKLPISALDLTALEPEHLKSLGRPGCLGPLRSLSVNFGSRNTGAPSELQALLHSPDLQGLSTLGLPVASPEALDVLVAQPHLAALQRLRVSDSAGGEPMGTRGARALSLAAHFSQLTALELDSSRFGEETFEVLSHARWPLAHLTVRRFANEPWLEWLSRPAWATRLHSLDVSTTCLSLAKDQLPSTLRWPALKEIKVREPTSVTTPGPHYDAVLSDWLERVDAPCLERLRFDTQYAAAGFAAALTRQAFAPRLTTLGLTLRLNDAVMSALAFGPWERLRVLSMGHGALGEVGARALSASILPRSLERLSLDAQVDNQASEVLAKGDWRVLRSLHLNGAVGGLVSSSAFPVLEQLTGSDQHDVVEAYVRSPNSMLNALELTGPSREELLALASCAHASRLKKLSIVGGQQLDDIVAQAFSASTALSPHTVYIRNAHRLTAFGKGQLMQKFRRGLMLLD
jgi:hypothetical protein